jgi:hypothetical protein
VSVKTERIATMDSGSPLAKHSLNQGRLYNTIRMEKKVFGPDRKKEKSQRRKDREAKELQRFLQQPDEKFAKALGHMVNGVPSEGDISFVARTVDEYEQVIESFEIERIDNNGERRITPVTITIVEFIRKKDTSTQQIIYQNTHGVAA